MDFSNIKSINKVNSEKIEVKTKDNDKIVFSLKINNFNVCLDIEINNTPYVYNSIITAKKKILWDGLIRLENNLSSAIRDKNRSEINKIAISLEL